MAYASTLSYNSALALTKVSILLQYHRFLYTPLMKNLCRLVLVFIILYGSATIITTTVLCLPLGSFWDIQKRHHCLDTRVLWLAHASLNIFTDIIIILLPLPVFFNLMVPKKQKYALIAVFAVGLV